LLGLPHASAPSRFAELPASTEGFALVQLSARPAVAHQEGGLAAIERDWLLPVFDALRGGSLRRLQLLILDRAFESARVDTLKLWRGRSPWWDTLRR
jgi:hypothetical protein